MLHPYLLTFIIVVQCGSFSKAAKISYTSPTAIMKQINALETLLGFKLLNRTHTGITLTQQGQLIYQNALILQQQVADIMQQANTMTDTPTRQFKVGSSLLNPIQPFMTLWNQLNIKDTTLQIVPYEDSHTGALRNIKELGHKFDFLVGVCDSSTILSYCHLLTLGYYKKMIAVPATHPLANKELIHLSDLNYMDLMMVPKGDSKVNDEIRAFITAHYPLIHLEDTPFHYDIDVFNKAVMENKALLVIECWQNIHPLLKSIPVDWDFTIPYGIMYPLHPKKELVQLLDTIQHYLDNPS